MPFPVPHSFPLLRRTAGVVHRRPLLLMGAGTSFNLVPLPPQLQAAKCDQASARLGCAPPGVGEDLYQWADRAVIHLTANHDPNAKLTLARSLDLLTDPCWRGADATERNVPRHRVIARFARERLWEQIWSLNWDCVQESAFENVGIKRDHLDQRLPWPTGFRTFVHAAECHAVAQPNMVHLIKPHGCVHALLEADAAIAAGRLADSIDRASRFIITSTDLNDLAANAGPTQNFVFATLCSRLSAHPLITVGWSAQDAYLLDYIDQDVRPQLAAQDLAVDELSIIDIAFHRGHPRLAAFYQKTEVEAHVPVAPAGFTTDALFLWIQALYGLERLRLVVTATIPADAAAIEQIEHALVAPPDTDHFAIDWVDSFLPLWVRLCWRCGLVPYSDEQYRPVPPEEFNLEHRDEHVPWQLSGVQRPDLISAARLLATLQRSGRADTWNFEVFPGGLYRESDLRLVMPLPAWKTGADNELRGIKPFAEALRAGKLPFQHLDILPLTADGAAPTDAVLQVLKAGLASQVGSSSFADPTRIGTLTLIDL